MIIFGLFAAAVCCVIVWAARRPPRLAPAPEATPARRPAESLGGRGEWRTWWCTECAARVHATDLRERDALACHHLALHRERELA